jgi:predicted dehydrogenase
MSVRIGFIGVGGKAQEHIRSFEKIAGAKAVSVFDINQETAGKVAESAGARVAASADELLNSNEIDAVFICVPQFARGDLEELAARRGIHIFAEKPLGLNLEEVRRKEQIIRESGVINGVGYVLRYYDTVRQAKEYLQGRHVHLVQVYRYSKGAYPSRWYLMQEMSGGHLLDGVTHQIDLVRYLVGEFRDVHAEFGRTATHHLGSDATIPNAGVVAFSMESGAVGSVTESCLSRYHGGSEIKLFGPDFFVHLTGNGKSLAIEDEQGKVAHTAQNLPTLQQNQAFVNAVIAGKQDGILSSYADGLRTLAVTLAAYQSAEERKFIDL